LIVAFILKQILVAFMRLKEILDKAAKELEGYNVDKSSTNFKINKLNTWGYSADLILKKKEIMT